MMNYLIAHRGLIDGPNPKMENRPDVIEDVLKMGFHAEIDVWLVDEEWWLGHDRPTYRVDRLFLDEDRLWIHCKNLAALFGLAESRLNYFWHDKDDFTLTSRNYIWTYPGQPLTPYSVCVQPEWDENWRENVKTINAIGICSKYVREIRSIRSAS